jgi:hypothetical protein
MIKHGIKQIEMTRFARYKKVYLNKEDIFMKKKLITLFLAFAMVLTMGAVSAMAEDGATLYDDLSKAELDKELTVADGIDISAVKDFTFSFTAKATDTSTVAETPAIAEQTVTVGAQSGGKATGKVALSEVFSGKTFPHAGVYMYEVVETTEGFDDKAATTDKVETLTVDSTKYNVRVYVVNGTNGTEVQGITVAKVSGETEEKVDPTSDGFIFKNEYKEELTPADGVVLTVSKSITGNYADKTKTFPVTVTLTLPSTATAADVALADDSKGTLSGTTVTADLADGDAIKFSKLPAGTTFTVAETQDAAYKSKITGFVATEDTALVDGNREVAGKGPVVEAGKTVSIENNRADLIPTGIVINNLPYIMLVVIAAAGILYLTKKRRSEA